MGASLQIPATYGDPTGAQPEEPHTSQAGLQAVPREDGLAGLPGAWQNRHLLPFVEKKREDPKSLGPPQSTWEPEGKELQPAQEKGASRTGVCLDNSTPSSQGQGEGTNRALKEVKGTEAEGRGVLPGAEGTHKGGTEGGHVHRLLASSPTGAIEDTMSGSWQEWEASSIPGVPGVLRDLGTKENSIPERPQEERGVTSVTRRKEPAEMALQDVVKVRAAERCACLSSSPQPGPQVGVIRRVGGGIAAHRSILIGQHRMIILGGGLLAVSSRQGHFVRQSYVPGPLRALESETPPQQLSGTAA